MLHITITPTALWFTDLDGEMLDKITPYVDLEISHKGGYCVKGTPADLYKILVKLSYEFDIELM